MSQTVLFEIGAVIFVAVSTAVFIYGLTVFRDWQDRDDTAAQVVFRAEADEPLAATAAPDASWSSSRRCSTPRAPPATCRVRPQHELHVDGEFL